MERKTDILFADRQGQFEERARATNSLPPAADPRRRSSGRAVTRFGRRSAIPITDLGQIEPNLAKAISRREFRVHFQAQFEVESGKGCGVEALARWTGPLGLEVPPAVFIPIAERLGLIGNLGAWILQHACEVVSTWTFPAGVPPSLSVNVSSHQIDASFCETVARILESTHFPGERLELEITESALIENMDCVIDCIRLWKAIGVRVAIDDFGTGYSSLNYLSRLPIDRLKLDRTFVHRMVHDRKTSAIVRSIFALAKDIGVSVLAEGIESERQMDALARLGCRQVQGYLFARPAPEEDARAHLATPWGTRLRRIQAPFDCATPEFDARW